MTESPPFLSAVALANTDIESLHSSLSLGREAKFCVPDGGPEAAAAILAAVMYPEHAAQRQRVLQSFVNLARWRLHNIYNRPELCPAPSEKPNRVATKFDRLDMILIRRLLAGEQFGLQIASAANTRWKSERSPIVVRFGNLSARRFTQRVVGKSLRDETDDHARKAYWRAARPILHMASALDDAAYRAHQAHPKIFPLSPLLFEPNWTTRALKAAAFKKILAIKLNHSAAEQLYDFEVRDIISPH